MMHSIPSNSTELPMPLRDERAANVPAGGARFAAHLARETESVRGDDRVRRAREAAAQFVGSAFIQPLLAQMRESVFAAGPFAPTAAEQRFGPMRDALLSDRIVQATNFAMTEIIAQRLLGASGEVSRYA